MPTRAYWQFYKEILPIMVLFTIMGKFIFGSIAALVIFLSFGICIGFLAFWLLKKNEFYFYYNLGLTKWKLFKGVFLMNLCIGTPIILLVLWLLNFLFGETKLI